MSMKPFTIKGDIKLINRRIFVNGDECFGTAECEGRRFKIRLSNKAITNGNEFLDTLLHELVHLWIGVGMTALDFKMSDAASHRIIDATVPKVAKVFYKEYKRRRK